MIKTGDTARSNIIDREGIPPSGEFLRFIVSAARPYRWIYAGVLAGVLFVTAAGYALPLFQKRLINALTGQGDHTRIWLLFSTIAVLYVIVRFEGLLQQLVVNSTVQKVMFTLKSRIMGRLLDMPAGLLDQLGGGYLSGRLNTDISQLQMFFSNTLFSVLVSILKVAGGLVFLFILNWQTGLATLVAFPFYAVLLYHFRGKQYHVAKQISEVQARNQRLVTNSLGSIGLLKTHAAENRIGGKIRTGFARETIFRLKAIRLSNSFLFFASLIPLACQGALAAVGVHLILRGQWSLGTLWALNCYMLNVFQPLRQLCSAFLAYQTALASAARLLDLERITLEPRIDDGLRDFDLKGEFRLRGLSFSYRSGNPILNGLDLDVASGGKLVITGPSGAGKSTLFALLLGFYKPEQGIIQLDGRPLDAYNVRSLRRKIGYIGATPEFINASLRANLTLGCTAQPSDRAMLDALAAAGAAGFTAALPDGLDTVLVETHNNFSVGERLRLALARELLRGCGMLLLDEATAHLDAANETHFLETVLHVFQGKTVLMIRHTPHPLTDHFPVLRLEHGNF